MYEMEMPLDPPEVYYGSEKDANSVRVDELIMPAKLSFISDAIVNDKQGRFVHVGDLAEVINIILNRPDTIATDLHELLDYLRA